MTAMDSDDRLDANQRHLMAEVARVRSKLEQYTAQPGEPSLEFQSSVTHADTSPTGPIETLCEAFELSPFERDILLLCVGMEVDSRFASLCGAALGEARRSVPTFGLALKVLPGAHWSALTPAGPLRHWRLIELGPGETLSASPLRVDERTLHHLTGTGYLDERLQSLVEPVAPPAALPASYRALAERIARLWSQAREDRPVIFLSGNAHGGKRLLVAAACAMLGWRLHALRASDIPTGAAERDTLIRLWERETVFSGSALLVEIDDRASARAAEGLAERLQGLLCISGMAPLHSGCRPVALVEINRPAPDEQRALWENALGPLAGTLNGDLDALVAQFPLDVESINKAGRMLRATLPDNPADSLAPLLWTTCRAQARQPLEGLAQRIEPAARWDDLVLPGDQHQTLHEIAAHVRQRGRVYEDWGFASRGDRGLGISALFAGPSGTGKTMAAEVLANELELDLYRIDLSQVVSKYIGETEKNLRTVFDAAEEAGAILLFDEADALFGKRSEVKDSHDRYANIEVSYLLQRMEAYRGLAILTSNQRGALDSAFLRRLRFVVSFPFPDVAIRARIWSQVFPAGTPTDGLDFTKLARLSVTGGNIRNIALNAAFLAADAGEPVRMSHLLHTARSECAKLEKTPTSGEIGGWL